MRYAKFVSTGALGITYYYKNNIGLMGFIKNVTELFQQLWQLWLSVTVIKYMQAQPDGNASSPASRCLGQRSEEGDEDDGLACPRR